MPAFVGFDLGMQRLELEHSLAVEIERRASPVFLEQLLDLDQPGSHDIADRQVHCLGQRLGQLTDDEIALADDFAMIRLQLTRDQAKRSGFAGTVPPDQAHPLARIDRKRRAGQYPLVAELE